MGGTIIKAIIIDLGDVIAFYDSAEFSKFIRDRGASQERHQKFFNRNKGSYDQGTLSGEDFWNGYIQYTHIKSTPDELKKKMKETIRIDQRMINELQTLRKKGIKVILASNLDENTVAGVKEIISLQDTFDAVYFSCEIGMLKREPAFFQKIINEQNLTVNKTLVVDDMQKNLAVAEKLGMRTHLFADCEAFKRLLR